MSSSSTALPRSKTAVRNRLLKLGAISESSRVIANHFSHIGGLTHAELSERLAPADIEVAYDGMAIGI